MSHTSRGVLICDCCLKAEESMIATHWVVGDKHYCKACWPRFRSYYEEGAGREAYYAPR